MKKITTLLVLTTAIITTSVQAQDGVFSGPGTQGPITTTQSGGFMVPASSITPQQMSGRWLTASGLP